jgi:lipopolysaccharide export system permease protein
MSREGIWTAFEGMWLSSFVLLPIGIFLTYKSAVDATLFNPEQYLKIVTDLKQKYNQVVRKRVGKKAN